MATSRIREARTPSSCVNKGKSTGPAHSFLEHRPLRPFASPFANREPLGEPPPPCEPVFANVPVQSPCSPRADPVVCLITFPLSAFPLLPRSPIVPTSSIHLGTSRFDLRSSTTRPSLSLCNRPRLRPACSRPSLHRAGSPLRVAPPSLHLDLYLSSSASPLSSPSPPCRSLACVTVTRPQSCPPLAQKHTRPTWVAEAPSKKMSRARLATMRSRTNSRRTG